MNNVSAIPVVKVGDYLRNNDPRENGKMVKVLAVIQKTSIPGSGQAWYQAGVRKAKISLDRIYADGKKRSTGWTWLGQHPAQPMTATEVNARLAGNPVQDGAGRV